MKTSTVTDSLHAYYAERGLSPTEHDFGAQDELDQYAQGRATLFRDRLRLPLRLFDHATLFEIGPDTGENALVFARWGAKLTLVEPNQQAHIRLRANFDKFNLNKQIQEINQESLESFNPSGKADIITAEGFIYCCRPTENWMQLFSKITRPEGLVVLSFYEPIGGIMELIMKLIVCRIGKLLEIKDQTAPFLLLVKRIFGPKWQSINHTRRFNSWVMDVLENPFVRRDWFLDAAQLCRDMNAYGFQLYSSWPRYTDGLAVHWHKYYPDPVEQQIRRETHIERSLLSFLIGLPLYLLGDAAQLAQVRRYCDALSMAIDGLIDGWNTDLENQARSALVSLQQIIVRPEDVFMPVNPADRDSALQLLVTLDEILALLGRGETEAVISLCRENSAFLNLWGSPYHYTVFCKKSE